MGANGARAAPVEACGKFLYKGAEKIYLRGVTYGTFRAGEHDGYPAPAVVARDFSQMAANGVNAVRTYSVPPIWLLDLAWEYGLYVMVGLPWEQHVAFLDLPGRADSILGRVAAGVEACACHPAVLSYIVGNEIPAPIVRWHGRRRIERFIERLYRVAKDVQPHALVSYVNYPTTEYLQLPFLDFVCFNVYLEDEKVLDDYLARLQNIAGERPLVMTEIGMDSRVHGHEAQAIALDWQIRTTLEAGCAGAFVFSWTDEWHRGGHEVEDWDFGLVDRAREPKPALAAVREAFAAAPFSATLAWPRFSVVVCTHNGTARLRNCLEGIAQLDYPDFECIVVDDGSTDGSAEIAAEFDVRLIRTENDGLASARNQGLCAAAGEIVAYIDDDARPDPHWLRYLAITFMSTAHAAVGGPNLPPAGHGIVADCVAKAPGGPTHVLISDQEAEHIPGCNMAFRRQLLDQIGGFDPQFRIAGDDVDVCWRLHEQGWTIGFSPAAVVWHQRRTTVRAYLKQQNGYGRAEALLERKWPDKYNHRGHPSWTGRVYGGPYGRPAGRRWRVYYGTWGSALFQSIYSNGPATLSSLLLMPEWYLLAAVLGAIAAYGLVREPVFAAIPGTSIPITLVLFVLCVLPLLEEATRSSWAAWRGDGARGFGARALTTFLYLGQPVARMSGRLRRGLSPWRRLGAAVAVPRPRTGTVWSDRWRSLPERLALLEGEVRMLGIAVLCGGEFDRWDIEARAGQLGGARLRLALEEHGEGGQLVRYRVWPTVARGGVMAIVLLLSLAGVATGLGRGAAALALAGLAGLVALRTVHECAVALPLLLTAAAEQANRDPDHIEAALTARVHAAARRSAATREHPDVVASRGEP
jgi:GT2 family glycosyltransferase